MGRTSLAPQTTVELPPLSIRADVATIDEEARTVELVFSTGAAVDRMDWWSGKRYVEKLSLNPKHIRLDRLNAGGPLLDSHSSWSVTDQLGAVVPGSVRLTTTEARATVRFSKREAVEEVWQDVRDGIISSVSVGYRVHKFEEDAGGDNKVPVRTAVDWEPYEVSMVSMPADAGAKTRGERGDLNQCVIVTRQLERTMPQEQSETIVEQPILQPRMELATEEVRQDSTAEKTPAEVAQLAERARCQGILLACRAARMPSDMYDKLVAEGITLEAAQTRIFNELQKRVDPLPNQGPNAGARRIEMGDDPLVHLRSGIENALLHRVAPQHFKLEDKAREYRGMTMLDVAKAYLQARGVRISGMSKMEIAGAALGLSQVRGGMHTTSDFPYLLADVAHKSLRAAYAASPQTFSPIVKRSSLSDFKAANRVQLGDAPSLKPVKEHGEFTRGAMLEGREQIQLGTYGRVFSISRTALVNDDTDAFSRVPQAFGIQARNLESDLVWVQILSNPTMGDSNALFVAAHANYAAAGLIGLTTINAGQVAMMKQTGVDATTLMNVMPRYLIVPPSQSMRAQQFVSVNMTAALAQNINPFAGKLEVITEARLEVGITIGGTTTTGSAFAWYLAADPAQIDVVELAMLDGQDGPMVESRVGFDIDGLEIKCRHDVGAKTLDWRGLYKNDGSDAS